MRTIGIDLSVKGEHKAVITDEQGRFVSPVLQVNNTPTSLKGLLGRAQENNAGGNVQAVMEPTGMAWLPVAIYLVRQGVRVFLVNSQQVADLRRYYKKHAKSDRIDSRILARLPLVNPENLHTLELPGAVGLACQRGCKQLERLQKQVIAAQNRLIALDRFVWPGLEQEVFSQPFSKATRWFRDNWYDPQKVSQTGVEPIQQAWIESQVNPGDAGEWVKHLVALAQRVMELSGPNGEYLDYVLLAAEAVREQTFLRFVEVQHHQLQIKVVRPLYRLLHPSRNLETIPGVGQDGACVYTSFIGRPQRFGSLREHRGWSGMVPNSKQSADSQAKGLKITQAGPRLIKKFSYLDADTARKYDPQIAAIYYDQMVKKGKHHVQAICTCASHLLDRILVVYREDRPYVLRDVDGTLVSKERAMALIQERYQVPVEIRLRNKKRTRKEQVDRQAEKWREGKLRKKHGVAETPQTS